MKKYFTLVGVTLLAMTSICLGQGDMSKAAKTKGKPMSQSSPDKAVMDRGKELWEIVKNKRADAFRKYFADGYSGVSSGGVKGINQEVEGVRNVDLKEYSLTDMKDVFPNKGTAVLT